MSYLLVCVGLVLLIAGGEVLVRAATSLAQRLGLSPMVIGLTIVAFGTSLPELVTSLQAALRGQPDIAVGNVVGSNIANGLLILGAAALVSPIIVGHRTFVRDGLLLTGATALAIALAFGSGIGRIEGLVLVIGLAVFLTVTMRDNGADEADDATLPLGPLPLTLLLIGGLLAMVFGAGWFVTGAADVARQFGVSEAVIGLSLVALGTSLPELATSIIAARKGQSAMALGNVIGSNIFNIVGILGITALITPLTVAPQILAVDLWVMAAVTVLLLILCRTGWRVTRLEGALLLACYAGYIGWLAL
jgi:cation:H+ antiporter